MKFTPIIAALSLAAIALTACEAAGTRQEVQKNIDGQTVIAVTEAGYTAWVAGKVGLDDSRLVVTRDDGSPFAQQELINEGGQPPQVTHVEQVSACGAPLVVVSTSTHIAIAGAETIFRREIFNAQGQHVAELDDAESSAAGRWVPSSDAASVRKAAGC